jgi:hypothetical protein
MPKSFLILALTAAFAASAYAIDRTGRPQPSPEMKQCFASCKEHKDPTKNEACMVKCTEDHPMSRSKNSPVPPAAAK